MEELKNHNWGLTLVFCLIFGALGFIAAKVSGSGNNGGNRMMMHRIHSDMGGMGKTMKWNSKDGEHMVVTIDGEDGPGTIIIDLDTTFTENGQKIHKIEKRVTVED